MYELYSNRKDAWIWVPLANIGEGLPYAIINVVLVAMLADLRFDAGLSVLVASICALPWSLKALWSPVVEAYGTRKSWMSWTQFGNVVLLLVLTCTLSHANLFFIVAIAMLFALCASTYDIACDGHYMRVLPPKDQAFFVGVRTTAYRIGMLIATGGMTALCGWLILQGESVANSWRFALALAVLTLSVFLLRPISKDRPNWLPQDKAEGNRTLTGSYLSSVKTFFLSKGIKELSFIFAFLFLYRLGEALLSKVTILFLKDTAEKGGLALNNEQYGLLYGTCGMIALIAGGILGGMAISRYGLKRCLIPMALMLNLPDLLYVWLSYIQAGNLWLVGSCVSIEQFGYGFGLAAYTVYLMQCAKGSHETAHYAFLTAIMGLSLTLPSMLSGYLQQHMGYTEFFTTTCLFTIPGIILSIYYVCVHRS